MKQLSFVPASLSKAAAAAAFAAALAAAPAHAAFVYQLDVGAAFLGGQGDFQLTVDNLIAGDVVLQLADFDFIDAPTGTTSVRFVGFDTSPYIDYTGSPFGLFWSSANAFIGPGTYCAGFGGCGNTAAAMTIRELGNPIPEPTSWALAGLALAAACGASRRRA